MTCILVTGGAGYIGSHTCVELLSAGHDVVVVDNLCNSSAEALHRVEQLAGRPLVRFYEQDVRDRGALGQVFRRHDVDAVIHFAALKAVGESTVHPLEYYDNNVNGTVTLTEAMRDAGVKTLVFSSSATVYGEPASVPIREDFPTGPTNPYGRTKWMMEQVLRDLCASDEAWHVALLRYFNPVGAHPSGRIGESPHGPPNNLMPCVAQVAVGRRPKLAIFGDDYPTYDGTGVRDYLHVVDLARGHVSALARLVARRGVLTANLGTGRGYSVLDLVHAFEAASGRAVPYEIAPRRPGDIAACFADPSLAAAEFGWRAQLGLREMCADTWRWQRSNPDGY